MMVKIYFFTFLFIIQSRVISLSQQWHKQRNDIKQQQEKYLYIHDSLFCLFLSQCTSCNMRNSVDVSKSSNNKIQWNFLSLDLREFSLVQIVKLSTSHCLVSLQSDFSDVLEASQNSLYALSIHIWNQFVKFSCSENTKLYLTPYY